MIEYMLNLFSVSGNYGKPMHWVVQAKLIKIKKDTCWQYIRSKKKQDAKRNTGKLRMNCYIIGHVPTLPKEQDQ